VVRLGLATERDDRVLDDEERGAALEVHRRRERPVEPADQRDEPVGLTV
jgi:hypothetical protein